MSTFGSVDCILLLLYSIWFVLAVNTAREFFYVVVLNKIQTCSYFVLFSFSKKKLRQFSNKQF